jgi:hypothetical protein
MRMRLLLQFCVFGFSLLEDGDVRVGVLPEREEILVGLKTIKIVTESSSFELPESVSNSIIDRVMAKLRADRS